MHVFMLVLDTNVVDTTTYTAITTDYNPTRSPLMYIRQLKPLSILCLLTYNLMVFLSPILTTRLLEVSLL